MQSAVGQTRLPKNVLPTSLGRTGVGNRMEFDGGTAMRRLFGHSEAGGSPQDRPRPVVPLGSWDGVSPWPGDPGLA